MNEKKEMPHQDTRGAPVVGGTDVTKFINVYESLSCYTRTNSVAEDVIATFTYYCSETMYETIKTMVEYRRTDSVQLNEQLKDAF